MLHLGERKKDTMVGNPCWLGELHTLRGVLSPFWEPASDCRVDGWRSTLNSTITTLWTKAVQFGQGGG